MYSIETLAKMCGVTRRTIRYYVQIGILAPPQGGGRGSHYTAGHINRLNRIAAWIKQGVTLMAIKQMLSGQAEPALWASVQNITVTSREHAELPGGVSIAYPPGIFSAGQLRQLNVFVGKLLQGDCNEKDCEPADVSGS